MPEITTLPTLCAHVAGACEPDALAHFQKHYGREFSADERKAYDAAAGIVCGVGAQWFAKYQPEVGDRAYRMAEHDVRREAERTMQAQHAEYCRLKKLHPDHCGFAILAFLATSFISWLLGQLFSRIWNWWKSSPHCQELCRVFAGEAQAAGCGVAFE